MFSAAEFMDAARTQTGLDDFGDDYFREGLERLIAAANTEFTLTETGTTAFRARAVSYLVNRLEIEHWYRKHPEIDEEEIVAPVFGLGLPRTGSTYLQSLMALDPAVRPLRTWESEKPCPPPTKETENSDPRIAAMEAAQGGFAEIKQLAPEILAMIPMETVKDPAECHDLLGLTFRGQAFLATILFSFTDWQISCDMAPAYAYHKRALKLLQWRCPPKRWRLKSPVHMFTLPGLSAVYPDARFVVTHRDVVASIPSMVALLTAINGMFVKGLDPKYIGTQTSRRWRMALDAMDAFRNAHDEKYFFDVGYRRAQSEPTEVLREMYAWLGEDLTPEFNAAMDRWRAERPKNKHGKINIDPAEYGLDVDTLRNDYGRYLDRYRKCIAN